MRWWKFYNKQLLDIGEYKVYTINQKFTDRQKNFCSCFERSAELTATFVVLINTKTKAAQVILSAFGFSAESRAYQMNYQIKGHTIILKESAVTDGEGGRGETFSKEVHVLKNLHRREDQHHEQQPLALPFTG